MADQELNAPEDPRTAPTENEETPEMELPDPSFMLSYVAMQMDTQQLLTALLAVFDGHAWRSMGLVTDPRFGETRKDLPAAQLAIDSVRFLLEKIGNDLTAEERRDAHRRLNDLQMNFVSRSRES